MARTAAKIPSPPFRAFRGEREGPSPQGWEGEVDIDRRSGIRPLTPTLSPGGAEGASTTLRGW